MQGREPGITSRTFLMLGAKNEQNVSPPFTSPAQKYTKPSGKTLQHLKYLLDFPFMFLPQGRVQYGISNNEFTYIQQPGSIFFIRVLHESNLYMKLSYLEERLYILSGEENQSFFYTHRKSNKRKALWKEAFFHRYTLFLDCSFVFPAAMLGNHSYNFSNTFPSGLRKSFISD